MSHSEFDQIFRSERRTSPVPSTFIRQRHLAPVTGDSVPVSNVSFEPGCRNNWHIHHGNDGGGDQILLCTAGSGWYQAEGEDPVSLEPATVIQVAAGAAHPLPDRRRERSAGRSDRRRGRRTPGRAGRSRAEMAAPSDSPATSHHSRAGWGGLPPLVQPSDS